MKIEAEDSAAAVRVIVAVTMIVAAGAYWQENIDRANSDPGAAT